MSASKAIIVPRPSLKKKTTQIKDTSMIKKNKKKFSSMKTLFSNAFVCTKPKLQEQSNSVSDHHRNAAAAAAAAAAEKELVVNKKNEDSSNKSINDITYEMNPYYISHKFPFYNTQLIVNSEEEDDEDDSDKPVYDEERPPMEIVSFIQRKAAKQEIIVEQEHDELQEEEEEEEFVNPFGKDGKFGSLNSCFLYKRRSQIRRSSCINNPHAAILLH